MITRLSTGFVVLLGLTALVNAGVPAARHTGHPDSRRNNFMRVARDDYYVALARNESPEPDPGKSVVLGREESPEPDPGKPVVLGREESPEPDPGKPVVLGREESPEPDPGKPAVLGRGF